MTAWKRLKNLWKLSGTAPEWQEPFESQKPFWPTANTQQATIIPYEKVDPIKKITQENGN